MPRKFGFIVPYSVPVVELHRAITSDELWHARFDNAPDTAAVELSHPSGPGTIRITMRERPAPENIPAIVRKVLEGDLTLERTDNWQALAGETAEGAFTASSGGITSELVGSYELRPTAGGSEIEVVGRIEVKVPLVGRVIEPLAEQVYHRLLSGERTFIEHRFATRADS